RLQQRVAHSWGKQPWRAEQGCGSGVPASCPDPRKIAAKVHWRRPIADRLGGDLLPKAAQLLHTGFGRVAGDQGGVDCADRDTRNPVGLQICFGKRVVDASLIGAERASALQEQGDAVERRAPPRRLVSRKPRRRERRVHLIVPYFSGVAAYCIDQPWLTTT